MRKGFFTICSVLLVLVVSIAVLVPGCIGEPRETCEIWVLPALCGEVWEGDVTYTLTGPDATYTGYAGGAFNVTCGEWTCDVSDGPPGAYLVGIDPGPTQTVSDNGTIAFALLFEREQDASIEFIEWTVNGDDIGLPGQPGEYQASLCNWIDVHFYQYVDGCEGYEVTVNETSWLSINQTQGNPGVQLYVLNHYCAVDKGPIQQGPTPVKVSQVASFNGTPVEPDMKFTLPRYEEYLLDVETIWKLEKLIEYRKAINWFGISQAPFDPPGEHQCVLFELLLPGSGIYKFTLSASAEVALMDDTDVNPEDNSSGWSPPLTLTVTVP